MSLKKLAGQTIIYGTSTIVGRVLNYLLVPLYTRVFVPQEYGVVTELYAYVSFLIVIFSYGMETAFFRFYEQDENKNKIFGTATISLFFSSTIFSGLLIIFSQDIADFLYYPQHRDYIVWFALILGLDALTAIPFSKLRQENKAIKFAVLKLINIGSNIGLNLFFLVWCPQIMKHSDHVFYSFTQQIYHPDMGVGYVFISNLVSSLLTILLFIPTFFQEKIILDKILLRKMIKYAMPLVIVGMAGIINETMDRIFLKLFLPLSHEETMGQIGIYGACYKLSLLMSVFIQAFRFAAEPFFFKQSIHHNAKEVYAEVMKYFVIIGCIIFLTVMLYLDVIKYFVGKDYHSGLKIVPVLLVANLCLGVYYNLSIWYKLTDQTNWGAWISVGGAVITIVLNYWLIPIIGFIGSAWATLACYSSMMVASYLIGQKHYRVEYEWKKISGYAGLSLLVYLISTKLNYSTAIYYLINSVLFLSFLLTVFLFEKKKKK